MPTAHGCAAAVLVARPYHGGQFGRGAVPGDARQPNVVAAVGGVTLLAGEATSQSPTRPEGASRC